VEFTSAIYNSKSREILKLDQKEKFWNFNLSVSMPSLENCEQKEDAVLYF
jgi:hypothetical protein